MTIFYASLYTCTHCTCTWCTCTNVPVPCLNRSLYSAQHWLILTLRGSAGLLQGSPSSVVRAWTAKVEALGSIPSGLPLVLTIFSMVNHVCVRMLFGAMAYICDMHMAYHMWHAGGDHCAWLRSPLPCRLSPSHQPPHVPRPHRPKVWVKFEGYEYSVSPINYFFIMHRSLAVCVGGISWGTIIMMEVWFILGPPSTCMWILPTLYCTCTCMCVYKLYMFTL